MHSYWEVPAQEYIKEELTIYMEENKLSSPQEAVDRLLELMPPVYEEEWWNYSSVAKAWIVLQISKHSHLTYHKSEELGEFIYDVNTYAVRSVSEHLVLQYIGDSGLEPILPCGLKSCREMFYDCKLPKGFTLGDKFDTSKIENMSSMFYFCIFPEGFTLGDKFDTSNVTDMSFMFYECILPEGFTLGDKFDTRNVAEMDSMFYLCSLPKGFNLGNKFNISKTTSMSSMFFGCTLDNKRLKFESKEIAQMLGGKSL